MGDHGVGFLRQGDNGSPPTSALSKVADSDKAQHRDQCNQGGGAKPPQTLLGGFAALHALFADIGSEGGPAVRRGINRSALFAGSFQEAVSPIMRIKADGPYVAAHNAFAENSTGKLLEAILFQCHQVTLADLGDGSDLLQRDAA